MASQELLFDYGFLNDSGKKKYGTLTIEQRKRYRKENSVEVGKYVDDELLEMHNQLLTNRTPSRTGYPDSLRTHRLVLENYQLSVEEMYYWMFNQLTVGQGFRKDEVIKITDVFAASEMSSYWGVSAQRLALQQDRASQYLKFIADMVKTMFQLIRDVGIVDEKLGFYDDSFSDDEKIAMDGEIVLKGQFSDLVEGGAKNPQSVFGLAQQVGFTTLPNLFFQTRIKGKTLDEVRGKIHDKVWNLPLGNDTYKTVLERKISQYYHWKFRTYDQLKTYRNLYVSYLRQHYNTIRLYMNWVKPYLRNIQKLSPADRLSGEYGESGNRRGTAELITAFESELVEIEILCQKDIGKGKAVIIARFDYRTMPQIDFVPNMQERRSVMVGRAEMNLKAYAWTKEQLKNYVLMKEEEDFELLKDVDSGLTEALDAIKDDIQKYLGDEKKEDTSYSFTTSRSGEVRAVKKGARAPIRVSSGSLMDPFKEIIDGAKAVTDMFSFGSKGSGKVDLKETETIAKVNLWLAFKYYKKAHRLIAW